MEPLIQILENADDEQIDRIIRVSLQRKQTLHPDWEFCVISLPGKGNAEREQHIAGLIDFLKARA